MSALAHGAEARRPAAGNSATTIHCVAAIDCGTTAIKCGLVDLSGRIVAEASGLSPLRMRSDGAVETDAPRILADVQHALADCTARASSRNLDVIGVSVACQRATVVCLDGQDQPLGPALSWQDMRGGPFLDDIRCRISDADYFRLTGLPNFPVFALAKLLWLRHREPERFQQARRFVLLHDFLMRGLGASGWVTDASDASLTGLLDLRTRRWSSRLLDLAGLSADRLPAIVESGTRVGALSDAAAQRTGLTAGIPIVAGAGDQQCAGIGAGAVEPGIVEITLGTAAVPLCLTPHPVLDPRRRVTCCVHGLPGAWNCEGLQNAAGSSVGWLAELRGGRIRPEEWADAQRVAPGAGGVLFFPYLLGAGAPGWNAEATGAFLGLRAAHSLPHLLRAVLEGVALENRAILDVFEELGVAPREVRLTGGLSQSESWTRIQAGIYGVPVVTLENPQATLMGAAVLAACGGGAFASPAAAAAQMVRVAQRFEPEDEERAAYEGLQNRYAATRRAFDAAELWQTIKEGAGKHE